MKKLVLVFRKFENARKNAEEVQISVTNGEVGHNLPSLITQIVCEGTKVVVHNNNKAYKWTQTTLPQNRALLLPSERNKVH
jgi:hypothetical protein